MFAYVLRNKINNKPYVGQTSGSVAKRLKAHKDKSMSTGTLYLYNAIRKYGMENFSVQVVECPVKEQWCLDWLEKILIEDLDAMAPNGYNLKPGGQGGPISDLGKKRMRLGQLGKKMPSTQGGKHTNARKILLTKPDGSQEEFDCMLDACRKYGLNSASLSHLADGSRNSIYGYKCKYLDNKVVRRSKLNEKSLQ
jgi:hypothetical protein